jgi:hypothetical protein
MTAQIPDTFIYKRKKYSLIGIEGGDLATPEQFGMEPVSYSTACYRGFFVTYRLTEKDLYLSEMTLTEKNDNYLPIGGIEPTVDEYEATYRGLHEEIQFTGKIRLARRPLKNPLSGGT